MLRIQAALPERYTAASPDELAAWIGAAKATLGDRLLILGHHYQRDEVMAWADARGDSFGLSRLAADNDRPSSSCSAASTSWPSRPTSSPPTTRPVILPDLNAGCSMADMADLDSVEEAWEELAAVTDVERIVPITYMNSSAALKAFVGRHGGAVCTSSNARAVVSWALERGDKLLFFPDQHLGRNTGYQLGFGAADMRVWNPKRDLGGLAGGRRQGGDLPAVEGPLLGAPALPVDHVDGLPGRAPRRHRRSCTPSAPTRWSSVADQVGSTDFIIKAVDAAPAGSVIAIGTEIHLVQRLAAEHPDHTVVSLDPLICPCSTMFRIDAAHLAWVLENLVEGTVVNQIKVDPETAERARVACERMLEIV